MYPKHHIILGLIFSIVLYFFPGFTLLQVSIVFLSSFLIDVDHYLYYVFRKKDLSLRRSYSWFIKMAEKYKKQTLKQKQNSKKSPAYLHGLEIILILYLLGYFISNLFYFVAIGFLFHLILDYIEEYSFGLPFYKYSVIHQFIRSKKLKHIEDA